MNKEELKEKLKQIGFEECSEEEALSKNEFYVNEGCIQVRTSENNSNDYIYFKPVQTFPIIFEGENYRFIIQDGLGLIHIIKADKEDKYTEKDIKANQDALDKLKELRQ